MVAGRARPAHDDHGAPLLGHVDAGLDGGLVGHAVEHHVGALAQFSVHQAHQVGVGGVGDGVGPEGQGQVPLGRERVGVTIFLAPRPGPPPR